jgi:hypothetical protein
MWIGGREFLLSSLPWQTATLAWRGQQPTEKEKHSPGTEKSVAPTKTRCKMGNGTKQQNKKAKGALAQQDWKEERVKEIKKESEDEDDDDGQLRKRIQQSLPATRRLGGDGESLPVTPPNEAAVTASNAKISSSNKSHPFSFNVTVDMMAVMLLVSGLVTRLWRLDQPRNVV